VDAVTATDLEGATLLPFTAQRFALHYCTSTIYVAYSAGVREDSHPKLIVLLQQYKFKRFTREISVCANSFAF
jgi:hypothetical protein